MTDEEIERVARKICTELGLDPEQRVGAGFGDDRTQKEWADAKSAGECGIPMVALLLPQWSLYRAQAAVAIATSRAVA